MDRNEIEVTRLNEQIADLKAELVELSGKVRAGIDDVERAAQPAIDVVRSNPGTFSSVAVTAGIVGLAVGYMLGTSAGTPTARWH